MSYALGTPNTSGVVVIRHPRRCALRMRGAYLRLPKGVDPAPYAEAWGPLMRYARKRGPVDHINEDLSFYTGTVERFRARVERWRALLSAQEIENTPLELFLEKV